MTNEFEVLEHKLRRFAPAKLPASKRDAIVNELCRLEQASASPPRRQPFRFPVWSLLPLAAAATLLLVVGSNVLRSRGPEPTAGQAPLLVATSTASAVPGSLESNLGKDAILGMSNGPYSNGFGFPQLTLPVTNTFDRRRETNSFSKESVKCCIVSNSVRYSIRDKPILPRERPAGSRERA